MDFKYVLAIRRDRVVLMGTFAIYLWLSCRIPIPNRPKKFAFPFEHLWFSGKSSAAALSFDLQNLECGWIPLYFPFIFKHITLKQMAEPDRQTAHHQLLAEW